ncbi:T9SS type A sorting domain-containing protein [Flectobacillus major]|uniref:T9SS type A sorting domain-containing protein n=1 Tax=Flectobacillus major TaxID=103 RepID=UPI00041BD9B3|nr:T9SS type A sorting domain-containing protein [Flectobacillus major]
MNNNWKQLGTALLMMLSISTIAQKKSISQSIEDKEGKLKIHVESSDGDKKEVFDRTYETAGLSRAEKDQLVSRITDSLLANSHNGERAKLRIKVDTDRDTNVFIERQDRDSSDIWAKRAPRTNQQKRRVEIYRDGKRIDKGDEDTAFSFDFRSLGKDFDKSFKDFDRNLRPQIEHFNNGTRSFAFIDGSSNEVSTIKGLRVYPNKPFDNRLNLKFVAPDKGDVSITITDVKGKEVGSQKIKDFEGEFMGQVELKKNTKGTLFVTVTQKEDGTVKRVVVE